MRRPRRIHLVLALVFAAVLAVIAYTLQEGVHEFDGSQCSDCHLNYEVNPRQLTSSVTAMCRKCHKGRLKSVSHPVDMVPAMVRVPADLPLRDGYLTCNTCHNIHGRRYNAFGLKTDFLRRPSKGRDFCASCHEDDPSKAGHMLLMGTAHIGRKYFTTDEDSSVDAMSLECIGCHDGTVGPKADYVVGKGYWRHDGGSSHPIGVSYIESMMSGRDLKPLSELSRKVHLIDGKVGCVTCHEPYSDGPGKLVMINRESRLCRECHHKK